MEEGKSSAKLLIGTVKGGLHDIGKNLAAKMLEDTGFGVVDLGTEANYLCKGNANASVLGIPYFSTNIGLS